MRCGDAVRELWQRLGEPSDFNPGACAVGSGPPLAAGLPLLNALNAAQDAVATWIDARGRRIRFRCLEDSFFFNSLVIAVDAFPAQSGVAPWKQLTLPATLTSGIGNRFANWTLLLSDGRSFRVTQSSATMINLGAAATTSVVGLTATLSKRSYEIDTGNVDAVVYLRRKLELDEVIDLSQQTQLSLAADDEHFVGTAATVSVPTLWSKRGGRVEFATAPADVRSYEVRLTRYPRQCVNVDDVYELPDAFQGAMLVRAEWWGNGMLQEPQMAYAKKRDFVELMSQLRDEIDFESDHTQDFFRVRTR